ncbi:MAG: phosphoenolpyruvate--protein phosphotransferase [Spirochaetia bacterium]|jgi:phosphotransferase system enzyme I (PtsI)|nr:phosphoenolpyruvate--protein phosphotransferase [Spirochaetia bacterium]
MEIIKGISASPGIYMGKVFLYYEENLNIPKYKISDNDVENENNRFHEAIEKARNELETIKGKAYLQMGDKELLMLDSHILMLSDPDFLSQVSSALEKKLRNVEWVLFETIENLIEKLKSSRNSYMQDRESDLKDVSKRVLNNLMFTERLTLSELDTPFIIAAHDLLPSDAITMDKKNVKGIILDAGGRTAHTAIIARSFEIPAVVGLSTITRKVRTGVDVIVDGDSGIVVVEPDEKTRLLYIDKLEKKEETTRSLRSYVKKEAVTNDGQKIIIKANIELPEEIESAKDHGADGIGLFRSEFLLLQSELHSSETRQYEIYKSLLVKMKERPVTIRTLDIGGDKILPGYDEHPEKNPLLGWRGIRFCLSNNSAFKIQLRALYRASVHGDLRIMFPMISCIEEVDEILEIIKTVKQELGNEKIDFNEKVPIGVMIEVPAAVLAAEFIAKKVDFFSIGTNDLIQYAIAIDRGNEKIAYLYQPYHPAVLRLIKMTVDAGKNAGIPVSLCGEVGGDPVAAIVLLGLGLEELSMSPVSIPVVKKVIRNVEIKEAKKIIDKIFGMGSGTDINNFLEKWFNGRFSGLK